METAFSIVKKGPSIIRILFKGIPKTYKLTFVFQENVAEKYVPNCFHLDKVV